MVWVMFVHGELNVLYMRTVCTKNISRLTGEYLMFYIFLSFSMFLEVY